MEAVTGVERTGTSSTQPQPAPTATEHHSCCPFATPHSCAPAYLPALDHPRHDHGARSFDRRPHQSLLLQDVSLRQRTARWCGIRLARALLLVIAPPCSPHPPRGVPALHSVERRPSTVSPVRACVPSQANSGETGIRFLLGMGTGQVGSTEYMQSHMPPCSASCRRGGKRLQSSRPLFFACTSRSSVERPLSCDSPQGPQCKFEP